MKAKFQYSKPILPYGVSEPWDDLNPRLYHAIHIYWLKFYGMWYNEFTPKDVAFWAQIVYTLIILWLVCFLPCTGEVVYLLKRRENIGDIAEGLYLFLSEAYTYFKIAVFWINRRKVEALLQYLHSEEFKATQPEHRPILIESMKRPRRVMTCYSAMCVAAVSAIIMPMTENFDILPTNVEYPFFDVYKSPFYEIIYVHHIYYKPATCIIDGVMDTMLAAFIASAIGQIEILSFNLRNVSLIAHRRSVTRTNVKRHMRSVLKDCIIHHNSIVRYVSMIESAFSLASALQFMLSVMVLCLIGIQFLSIEDPTSHPTQILWMVIYLTCMLIEVFILCWFGDDLIWKSTGLRQAAFDAPWPDLDAQTAKYIVIFLERCKRPMQVTAGKTFTLSLNTYTNLINWSYKAFAVMRNTKK